MLSRYFLELSYKGTNYSGFQTQQNANTVQDEVEKAFKILQRAPVALTGSSRTDAGVHALQNFFHFDFEAEIHPDFVYKMNAILPADIVIKAIYPVGAEQHSRFDASSRLYHYHIYTQKNPFLDDRAYYFPFPINMEKLEEAADLITRYNDFTSFSKRNTQVKTFMCSIKQSQWFWQNDCLIYKVEADRFLRGMVRALTATMLKVGRGKISLQQFQEIIEAKDCTKAHFDVPGHGLFLQKVNFLQPL